MKELPEKEVLAQLEKAYARATVALIRAQKLCIIMDPGHTGAAWGRYRNRLSQIWCRGLFFFFALCCLGKIPGGAPFSQLHKSGNGSRVDRP